MKGPRQGVATRRALAWAAVAGYAGVIFYLSSLTNPLPTLTSSVSDKVLHGIEYGGLGLLLASALVASGVDGWRAFVIALVGASLYGATDELHQHFVPGRSCDILDWTADTIGAATGAAVKAVSYRKRGTGKETSSAVRPNE